MALCAANNQAQAMDRIQTQHHIYVFGVFLLETVSGVVCYTDLHFTGVCDFVTHPLKFYVLPTLTGYIIPNYNINRHVMFWTN